MKTTKVTDGYTMAYAEFLLKNYRFLHMRRDNAAEPYAALLGWEIAAVNRALAVLSDFERQVIEATYVHGERWQDVMDGMFVSHMTISRFKKKAVCAIARELAKEGIS